MNFSKVPTRRFGRTEIDIPVLSLGGMRFQQSWEDLDPSLIKNQKQLERTIDHARLNGLNHIETARHYGTSERQIGWALQEMKYSNNILQTKLPPDNDPGKFETSLELSFRRLQCKKLDLFAFHGVNLPEHLHQISRSGGCLEVVKRWQNKGLIDHVGFSTHGTTDLILKAINSNIFDYVNLHWYFIRQDNNPALDAARKLDLGTFIISPTDKGGHLHTPSLKLLNLCSPLHPIVFNDLFCLRDNRIHTISVGLSSPDDLNLHLDAVKLLDQSPSLVPEIETRLIEAAVQALGQKWLRTWHLGLPTWQETPGHINIPILLWLHNLIQSWDLVEYSKARYGLLGKAGHWFPGNNADMLDRDISEESIVKALSNSPWAQEIIVILRSLRDCLASSTRKRLWQD